MFASIIQLYSTLNQENRTLNDLTEAESTLLLTIADESKGVAGGIARSWKAQTLNLYYENCLSAPDMGGLKKGKIDINNELMAKIHGFSVTATPNPASNYAVFEYKLPENQSSAIITISDIAGKVVQTFNLSQKQGQQIWNTNNLIDGIYLYKAVSGNQIIQGKLSIVK